MNNRPDQQVLDQLVGKVVGDEARPSTVEELSSQTGLNPKYLHGVINTRLVAKEVWAPGFKDPNQPAAFDFGEDLVLRHVG